MGAVGVPPLAAVPSEFAVAIYEVFDSEISSRTADIRAVLRLDSLLYPTSTLQCPVWFSTVSLTQTHGSTLQTASIFGFYFKRWITAIPLKQQLLVSLLRAEPAASADDISKVKLICEAY